MRILGTIVPYVHETIYNLRTFHSLNVQITQQDECKSAISLRFQEKKIFCHHWELF